MNLQHTWEVKLTSLFHSVNIHFFVCLDSGKLLEGLMENGQLHQIMLQKFSREIDLNPNEVNKTGSNQNSFLKKTFKFVFIRHPFERLVFFGGKKIIFTHSNAVVPVV